MIYRNSDLNKFLDSFFNGQNQTNIPVWAAVTNSSQLTDDEHEINYTADGAYLLFDAPGFNKTNLKVEIENGLLMIEGKRVYKLNNEETQKTISKQFKIGDKYNSSLIEATIEDGLLTVFVPNYKKPEKKRVSLL
jgi:HSP20 family molecular chaperone IbpA